MLQLPGPASRTTNAVAAATAVGLQLAGTAQVAKCSITVTSSGTAVILTAAASWSCCCSSTTCRCCCCAMLPGALGALQQAAAMLDHQLSERAYATLSLAATV
jgi:hypothetical protein